MRVKNDRDSLIEQAIQYAGKMYDINLSSFGSVVTKNDIVNEVISRNCSTEEELIRTVRDVVFFEKRRLIALGQQRSTKDITGEKVCGRCQLPKPVADYYTRTDYRNGFRYLCNLCKECERKRHNELHARKMRMKHSMGQCA